MGKSEAEIALWVRLIQANLGVGFVEEYQFHPTRRWRFDFAHVRRMLAVEVEGGVYSRGRHTRGKGFEADCEKYNAAVLLGWRVLRFTPKQVENGYAVDTIKEALCAK